MNKQVELHEVFTNNYTEFAKYTIQHRAIPALEDGCKDIHRRILWSMHVNKNTYDRNRVKANTAAGLCMAYSPHGNASIYGAIVRFANDSVNLNLIDGKGSFSSHTSSVVGAAADRYVEVRLSKIANEYMNDIDKDIAGMKPNYDETKLEPVYLPVAFPTILCNPNVGIATGIATNICAFNLKDVIDNTLNVLNNKETFLMIPDFPTGGEIVYNEAELNKIKTSGLGKIVVRSKYKFVGNSIVVTEIPYSTSREVIIKKVIDLVKAGTIKDVVDINDHTGKDGLKITIDVKKNCDKEKLMLTLFQKTPLQDVFGCNFNMLDNGTPKTLGYDDVIKKWLVFRRKCIVNKIVKDIEYKTKRLHLLRGLEKVLLDIDEAVKIIRFNDNPKEDIISKFNVDEEQAEYILNIKLRNINKEYILRQIKDNKDLEEEIVSLKENVSKQEYIDEIIKADLIRIKKEYGEERKTGVIYIDEEERNAIKQIQTKEVQTYPVKVAITKEGYVKKMSTRVSANHKLKDGDSIIHEFETTNDKELLVFSGTDAYKIQLDDLSDSKPSVLGDYIPTMFEINDIIDYSIVDSKYKYLIVLYETGKIAKIDLTSFVTNTKRKKLSNSLYGDSKVIKMFTIEDEVDMMLTNAKGKTKEINTSIINAKKSRSSQGVTVWKDVVNIEIK